MTLSLTTLAKQAQRLNPRPWPSIPRLPPLILLTDERRLADPLTVIDRLPRGAAVILRHYRSTSRESLARRLRDASRRRGVMLLVAADPDEPVAGGLAARIAADGIHLPERMVRRAMSRRPHRLVTAAAHSMAGLWRAKRGGADAALLSPVFATASHRGAQCLGPLRFAAMARRAPLPVYALGGITAANAGRLGNSGCVGLAGIGFAIE